MFFWRRGWEVALPFVVGRNSADLWLRSAGVTGNPLLSPGNRKELAPVRGRKAGELVGVHNVSR